MSELSIEEIEKIKKSKNSFLKQNELFSIQKEISNIHVKNSRFEKRIKKINEFKANKEVWYYQVKETVEGRSGNKYELVTQCFLSDADKNNTVECINYMTSVFEPRIIHELFDYDKGKVICIQEGDPLWNIFIDEHIKRLEKAIEQNNVEILKKKEELMKKFKIKE